MTAGPQGTLYALVSGLVNGYTVYAIDTMTLQATAILGPAVCDSAHHVERSRDHDLSSAHGT